MMSAVSKCNSIMSSDIKFFIYSHDVLQINKETANNFGIQSSQ